MGERDQHSPPPGFPAASVEAGREILSRNFDRRTCGNLEERTYTLLRNAARPGHPTGQRKGPPSGGPREGQRVAGRKTPAQKVAALERAERRALHRLGKTGRDQRTHAMCVLAGAIAAELRRDQAQALWVLDVVQRRVMKPRDLSDVMQWLSTL